MQPPDPASGTLLPKAVRDFLRLEAAGGLMLFGGALAAMLCANSQLAPLYADFLRTPVEIRVGAFQTRMFIDRDLEILRLLLAILDPVGQRAAHFGDTRAEDRVIQILGERNALWAAAVRSHHQRGFGRDRALEARQDHQRRAALDVGMAGIDRDLLFHDRRRRQQGTAALSL